METVKTFYGSSIFTPKVDGDFKRRKKRRVALSSSFWLPFSRMEDGVILCLGDFNPATFGYGARRPSDQ
ncbi:unnamed protein product [Pieris brassicae]|uniref:Uncharacterized protein n=1 Tax=Pieris brassicae TaxID=7116 RepID=A0A9P0T6Q1_PIEBR|nr:unnamed protein product [Pieris brassicae]